MKTPRILKNNAPFFVAIFIFIFGITSLLAAMLIPVNTNMNLDKYTGAKKQAALFALDGAYNHGPVADLFVYSFQIVDVVPNTSKWKCEDDPSKMHYYSVILRKLYVFGITTSSIVTYDLCRHGG